MNEETKITDMTFYQIENLVADLRWEVAVTNGKVDGLRAELDEWESGSRTEALTKKNKKLQQDVSNWKQVAADLMEQLLLAQRKLELYQIGVSPDIERVLDGYRNVRDRS